MHSDSKELNNVASISKSVKQATKKAENNFVQGISKASQNLLSTSNWSVQQIWF
jgi:hypothetical protein